MTKNIPEKQSIPDRLKKLLDYSVAFYALRLTDCFGWSDLANHKLRPTVLRLTGFRIGQNCRINPGIVIKALSYPVTIGDETFINQHCKFDVDADPIVVGKRCWIGFNVSFLNVTHTLELQPGLKRPIVCKGPLIIEDYVWIGSNAIIMPGVTVGEGAVVGAGAVVTKDVTPYTVVAGVPAKVIKTISRPETHGGQPL